MPRSDLTKPPLSSVIDKVLQQAQDTASHSWEYGVVFEALLEYNNPSLTVFQTAGSQSRTQITSIKDEVKALVYIETHIRTDSSTLCEGNGKPGLPA